MNNEKKIFNHLFDIAKDSDDQEGVVCACLTDEEGNVLASSPSFNDGRHAEYVVIEKVKEAGISYTQVDDQEIINKSADLFNSTIKVKLNDMELARKDKV